MKDGSVDLFFCLRGAFRKIDAVLAFRPISRLVLVLAAASASPALLAQVPVVGPRAAGMGGASVAVADDGTALWTNPAGLGRDPRIDIELFGGAVATNRGDFTAAVDRLSSIDLDRIRRGLDLNLIPEPCATSSRSRARERGSSGPGRRGSFSARAASRSGSATSRTPAFTPRSTS